MGSSPTRPTRSDLPIIVLTRTMTPSGKRRHAARSNRRFAGVATDLTEPMRVQRLRPNAFGYGRLTRAGQFGGHPTAAGDGHEE